MAQEERPSTAHGVAEYFPFAAPDARLLRIVRLPRPDDGVRFDGALFTVRFGPWRVRTGTANIASAEVAGPYRAWKALGARLSLADRGLTFGTVTTAGVCITFHEPVPGIEPTGLLRHPNLTVTVARPDMLAARLNEAIGAA
jgi:hypothetical protein